VVAALVVMFGGLVAVVVMCSVLVVVVVMFSVFGQVWVDDAHQFLCQREIRARPVRTLA
jgi:uncharacterized membrane protein